MQFFFFSSRRRHTRSLCDWSSDVCSSDLELVSATLAWTGTIEGRRMGQPPWWQRGVIYHIYPRSWMDSDGDGVGDLPGILARLDHLSWLGVDAVWISPVYPSPGADLGYDVADYTAIDPLFGTMDDMERLITAAHERGLRVLLDWVPNHTSDQHPWFQASRSDRNDPKRDWYVWRDPAPDGGPPTNWVG